MEENSTQDWYFCKHCSDVIDELENASKHQCFVGKHHIYSDESGNLFAHNSDNEQESRSMNTMMADNESSIRIQEEKERNDPECLQITGSLVRQNATWTKNATQTLISLYDAKKSMLDHPKKKTKIWQVISQGLKDAEIEMSPDQVRWKFNRLQKKYKECVDNNKKSGRAHMTFDFYDEMDEVFNLDRNVGDAETISSKMAPSKKTSNSIVSLQKSISQKENMDPEFWESMPSTSTTNPKDHPSVSVNRSRPLHGTGSNRAKKKDELEKNYLQHLKTTAELQKNRDDKLEKYLKVRADALVLKKQELEIRKKEMENRHRTTAKKLKLKEQRHNEIMEVEKIKCNLLRKLLKETNKGASVDSESD